MPTPTPRTRKPPTDHTGARREQLAKEHATEIAERQAGMAMATTVVTESDEVTDLSGGTVQAETDEAIVVGDGVETVSQGDGTVVIRVNTELEDVTIGAGNNYTFKEGQRYRVPAHVAAHLEEKGFVWH